MNARAAFPADPATAAAMLQIAALAWRLDDGTPSDEEAVEDWGSYTGTPPEIRLEDDGRKATLLSAMSYRRPDGSSWPVPAGATLDGASIPRPFWSVIGGPFEGKYRNASIVHDYYCDTQTRSWRDTHRMFYEAMRRSGTSAFQAKIMYYAVYRFGPRWGLERPERLHADPASTIAASISASDAQSSAADAEAIQLHQLSLEEIETLADFRNCSVETTQESPGMAAAGLERARLVVIPGGSGTIEDAEAVAASAVRLSSRVVDRFLAKGIRIVACRGSVTDFERSLRGIVPRGWEDLGKTWNVVPGVYLEKRLRVVVATVPRGGGRAVPLKTEGSHGSVDLVLHESLHGYDYSGGHAVLRESEFQAARTADFARLGTYERQDGQPGLEETYAESGARFLAEPDALANDWPALFGYWSAEGPVTDVTLEGVPTRSEGASLGTAEFDADGRIHLHLRAESDEAIGHASVTLVPGDPAYERVADRLGAEGLESDGGPVLLPSSFSQP